ncbi:MAG TPA: HlyD family secretion protein [Polyangiaceae bacterium]|nr:HlyD family secretion protein [Polyangiaceae bacterium]
MAQNTLPGTATPEAIAPVAPAAKAATSRKRVFIIGGVVAAVALAGSYWAYSRQFEDTDDAQVDGTISNISPRITGTVTAVYVIENQTVKQGDVIADIDPTDLKIALDQAKAQVAQAQAQLAAEDPNVSILLASNVSAVSSAQSDLAAAQAALSGARNDVQQLSAQIAQAEANDRQAQLEKQRSQRLVAQGAVAQADYDQHLNAAAASAANVDAVRQALAAAKDRVAQQLAQITALQSRVTEVKSNAPRQVATRTATLTVRQAALELAQAQEAEAETNLSYAKIVSPVTGIVAKKSLAVGDHVSPGQQVVAIAQTDDFWVTANYRETQLELVRPGQTATIHVDALGEDLSGTVESVGGATGARLSVLPPENAAGNFVKVVQRIPVRIHFEGGQSSLDRLRIGMSVEPRVKVR